MANISYASTAPSVGQSNSPVSSTPTLVPNFLVAVQSVSLRAASRSLHITIIYPVLLRFTIFTLIIGAYLCRRGLSARVISE